MAINKLVIGCLLLSLASNLSAGEIRNEMTLGDAISSPVISANGEKLYITTHLIDGKLIIINTKTWEIIKKIAISGRPFKPIIGKDNELYILTKENSKVLIINTNTDEITNTIKLPEDVDGNPTYDEKQNHLYILNHRAGKIIIVDLSARIIINEINFKHALDGEVAVDSAKNILYVISHTNGKLFRVQPKTSLFKKVVRVLNPL